MDVICNRCSTEYEFEEALVSASGTTVKCTQCGHMFKVQRASQTAPLAEPTCWTIRLTDGAKHTLADLSELPRRIREGSFGRDDELSRTCRLWRRLGDIDELDEHFVAADRRGPSRGQLGRTAEQIPNKLDKAPELSRNLDPEPEQRDSVHAVEAYRRPGVRNESRSHAWARLLTSAAIVLAIAIWFFSLPPSGEHWSRAYGNARTERAAVDDPSQRFFEAGESALATQRIDHFDTALVEYIKALAYREHDAHILSAVSRVHALWAQELLSEESGVPDSIALHAQQALHYAELALQSRPKDSEAELARADALRLANQVGEARAVLDRALEHMPVTAESLRVSTLQVLAEANHGEGQSASELATQALAIDPNSLRTRLFYARLLLLEGDLDAARAQIDAIKAKDPQHPAALRLEARLNAQASAAPPADEASAAKTSEIASYFERGRAQLQAGQLSAAKRTFEHVLTLQPDSGPAHAGLGQVAIARGRHVQAIDHLVAAALAGDAESLIALAETYRRLGRQHEALTAYQSYLQQNPHGPQVELAKAQSERLSERLAEQLASARKP